MRIESLELQLATNQKNFQFVMRPEKLTVIICKNEFARSIISNAVLSLLYGSEFNQITSSKLKGFDGARHFTITRDAAAGSDEITEVTAGGDLHIVDSRLSTQDKTNRARQGQNLVGIGEDVFARIFAGTTGASFSDPKSVFDLLSLSQKRNLQADAAIGAIDERLAAFPFKGRHQKLDDLISALSRGREVLAERLVQLQSERTQSASNLQELSVVEKEVENLGNALQCRNIFNLRNELTELEARIRRTQERSLYESELRRELRDLGDLDGFPISSLKKIEELWVKRASRRSDYDRLSQEIESLSGEDSDSDHVLLKGLEGLENCTLEDSQLLVIHSKTMQTLNAEIEELQSKRSAEMRRVKELGVDFDKVALVRKQLLTMQSSELQEANLLVTDLKESKEKLAESVKETTRIETQLQSLKAEDDRNRKTQGNYRNILLGTVFFPAVILVASWMQTSPAVSSQLVTIRLFTGVFLAAAIIAFVVFLLSTRKTNAETNQNLEKLGGEQKSQSQGEISASAKIVEIQQKLDRIAANNGLRSSVDLSRNIQAYASTAMQLKDLDVIDQILTGKETQLKNLSAQIQEIFEKAGRTVTIATADATMFLAEQIQLRLERVRESTKSSILDHRRSEQKFLLGELEDLDSQLRDVFYRARLKTPEDIAVSYQEFHEAVNRYRRYESLREQLARLEQERAVELVDLDLNKAITDMQHKQASVQAKLQEVAKGNPQAGRLSQDDLKKVCAGLDPDAAHGKLAQLRVRQKELTDLVRSASKNFDEFLPKTQYELETLDRDLERLRKRKKSLELARALINRIADESKSSWSEELSLLASQLVQGGSMDLQRLRFDEDLNLRPVLAGGLTAVSEACEAEMNLIARLSIAKFVSQGKSIPVILDEPFAQVDDEGFLAGMRMLLSRVVKDTQLIVLTTHQVRHQWLIGQLTNEEKSGLHFTKA